MVKEPTPVALSWSGGKDCTMALAALRADAKVDVRVLLTTVTAGVDRISMHGVRETLLARQSAALGIPVTTARLSTSSSNAEYESVMGAAVGDLHDAGIAAVAFGDLFLADVRAYRETQMATTGVATLFPLWHRDTGDLIRELLTHGYRAIVVCVDTEALAPSFCGREIDESFLADLPAGVDPCGENGEFHTFVFDGPPFAQPIALTRGEQVQRGQFLFQDLVPA